MEKTAKSKKEAKDEKLKEQKIEEQAQKFLEEAATPDAKLQLLLRKYVESECQVKALRQDKKLQDKKAEAFQREKENLQREYNKSVLIRDKLQEVCREQQKLIKSVKNESMQKIKEEEERRKESQTKFQSSLNEITQSLTKNNDENMKLRDHNIEMAKKLKFLAEQYQTREQQLEKLNEQVHLECKLNEAKLNKVQAEAAMEKEILIKEKQIALEKLLISQKQLREIGERERELKEQLHIYTEKYDEFQGALKKSSSIFENYKTDIDKMSKHTRKLEKECLEWKRKFDKCNATLIELATEKQERDDHALRCNKQVDQLQKLLRALQNERTHLYKVLRENNVEIPPLPALPPEPAPLAVAPINAQKDKFELMSRNCEELKQTFANLQLQMNTLSIEQEAAAAAKAEKTTSAAAKKRQKKKQKNNKKTSQNGTLSKGESVEDDASATTSSTTANGHEVAASEETVKAADDVTPEKAENHNGQPTENVNDEAPPSSANDEASATEAVEPQPIESTDAKPNSSPAPPAPIAEVAN